MKLDDLTLPEPVADAFRTLLLAAAWRVAATLTERLGEEAVAERFSFLLDYASAVDAAADDQAPHLPLQRLAQAAELSASAVEIWMLNGLIEEDARFAAVYEALDPESAARRPGMALMQSWWGTLPREGLRPALRALLACGLLRPCQAGATRADSSYEVEDNCWSALRGEPPARPAPGIHLRELHAVPALAGLTFDAATHAALAALGRFDGAPPGRLAPLPHASVIARGAEHNGRTSVLAALARAEGRRALIVDWPPEDAAAAPPWLGAFATLAWARPILRLRASPGERVRLPVLAGYEGWIGIACGSDDAIEALPVPALILRLPLPDAALRAALIARHGGPALAAQSGDVAARLHLSSGYLVSALRTMAAAPAAGCS
jgi:hypothetical protein